MTQVSRFKLREDIQERINELLAEVLLGIKNKFELKLFLDDFFSPIEKTVFSKRLAIAILLAKENDYANIARVLKVTPTTISKMSLHMKYGNGAMNKITEKILNKDSRNVILQDLASIFDVPIKDMPISTYYKKKKERENKIYRLKKEL